MLHEYFILRPPIASFCPELLSPAPNTNNLHDKLALLRLDTIVLLTNPNKAK